MRWALPSSLVTVIAVLAIGAPGVSAVTASGPGGTVVSTASPTGPVCVRKVPSQLGECVQQYEGGGSLLGLTAPLGELGSSARSQGVDISRWQGIPNLSASGSKFVLIQTNVGFVTNPFLAAQVAAARRAGIPYGFYTFTEAFSGARQARFALELGQRYRPPLGYWSDVEVSGAYEHACEYVRAIRAAGVRIEGVYSSPGLYFFGGCGFDWPAEWSSGPAFPLHGFTRSETVVRQWCGTCLLPGFSGQVDRDESLGLLELVRPPETPAQHRARVHRERVARLHADYRGRRGLGSVLTRFNCLRGYRGFSRDHRRKCNVWRSKHAAVNRDIKRLHRLGFW